MNNIFACAELSKFYVWVVETEKGLCNTQTTTAATTTAAAADDDTATAADTAVVRRQVLKLGTFLLLTQPSDF
jgi:hypothetical protein